MWPALSARAGTTTHALYREAITAPLHQSSTADITLDLPIGDSLVHIPHPVRSAPDARRY